MINNQTRGLKIRIPCYNPQIDVVGYFGWDVSIDRAGYWQFTYMQAASRRDPYAGNVRGRGRRVACEVFFVLVTFLKCFHLITEYAEVVDKFGIFGRCLRRLFFGGYETAPDFTTATLSTLAALFQIIMWLVIMSSHDDLNNKLIYIGDQNGPLVAELLTTIDDLTTWYRVYLWFVLGVFVGFFLHLFHLLKFQGKLNAISMVVSDTLSEILWFFTVFFLALIMFAGYSTLNT